MSRKSILGSILSIYLLFLSCPALPAGPSGVTGDEVLFSGAVKPNVLIILDNSNSMDEDFFGNAVGSWATGSKSVEGKRVLIDLVNNYVDSMRLGLMTYRLPKQLGGNVNVDGIDRRYLANSLYFSSYDPRSYCPSPLDACVGYCRTGTEMDRVTCQTACQAQNPLFDATYIDDSITDFSKAADPAAARYKYCGLVYPKTNRMVNPSDLYNYIYYKQPMPFYAASRQPASAFWASPGYIADDNVDTPNYYDKYATKIGTSDGVPQDSTSPAFGYSTPIGGLSTIPSESDKALGFNEFGKRRATFDAGRTFFSNNSYSPDCGNELKNCGYLQISVAENKPDNAQRDSLLRKMKLYEKDETGYMDSCTKSDLNGCDYIVNAGLTPTAGTLQSAISYFQGKNSPIDPKGVQCQRNFIVYVTDGLPNIDEKGVSGTADSLMGGVIGKLQTLRQLTVDVGKGSYPYDVKTYVVGVGLTTEAKSKLDSMARAGGTAVNDHAYYADDPDQLKAALFQVFSDIQSSTYSFSTPSVSSVRLQDENDLYAASFEPFNWESLWKGHLKKFQIKDTQDSGSSQDRLGGEVWDAGTVLEGTSESGRIIKTYVNGGLANFDESLDPSYFGGDIRNRNLIVAYVRGNPKLPIDLEGTTVDNPDYPRKLGDIFHSNPVTIGSPSFFFNDNRDTAKAFEEFRKDHQRSSSAGTQLIIVGANDGQLHAFEAREGKEAWSFIPPNLLPKLKGLARSSPSEPRTHQYFVDGPISAADVWLPSAEGDGTTKNESEWRTFLVMGLGMGVRGSGGSADYLWNKSPSCDQESKDKYNRGEYAYYCGYYALDVTDTSQYPSFGWILNPGDSDAPYLGEPWSKMVMGRVKINGKEKWVGFIGGGYNAKKDDRMKGKGFFVVDLKTGNILRSFTAEKDGVMDMIPGSPAVVDRDNDGFIDTAYVGDVSGNLWKFTFCPFNPDKAKSDECNTSNWRAMQLFDPEGNKAPIFTTPAVAKDNRNYWIFFGTGDRANPNGSGPQNRFFAIKDQNPTIPYKLADLSSGNSGWVIPLNGQERVLTEATVYRGIVFFTSYTPPTGENLCVETGTGSLYGIAMMPVVVEGERYDGGTAILNGVNLGYGIPSAPIVSQQPILVTDKGVEGRTPDLFIAVSGGAGSGGLAATEIKSNPQDPNPAAPPLLAGSSASTFIIHWKDRRLQPH